MSHFSVIFLTWDCRELPAEPEVSALFAKGQNNLKLGGTCKGSKKIWHNYNVNYSGCFKSPASKTCSYTTCFEAKAFLPGDKRVILEQPKKPHQTNRANPYLWCNKYWLYSTVSHVVLSVLICRVAGSLVQRSLWKIKVLKAAKVKKNLKQTNKKGIFYLCFGTG